MWQPLSKSCDRQCFIETSVSVKLSWLCFRELKAMQSWFRAKSLNNENCVPTDQKKTHIPLGYQWENWPISRWGEEKHTNKYNNCCFEITCPYPKGAVFASSKCIHSVLLELHAILHQMTWIPYKEENTEIIMFLLCKINNNSTAAQTQGHIDI